MGSEIKATVSESPVANLNMGLFIIFYFLLCEFFSSMGLLGKWSSAVINHPPMWLNNFGGFS